MIKVLNYILIFIFVVGLSLCSSMQGAYSDSEEKYKTRTFVKINEDTVTKENEALMSIGTAIGGILIKEGVGFATSFLRDKLDDYKSKEYSGSYIDLGSKDPQTGKYAEPTTAFKDINTIRVIRAKARYNNSTKRYEYKNDETAFDLLLNVAKSDPYIRLVPVSLEFNDPIGWSDKKDINIVCSFKFAKSKQKTKEDTGSSDKPSASKDGQKFIMPPVTFEDMYKGEKATEIELAEAATEWREQPTVENSPYTLTVQVVESSGETGKKVAEIFRKAIDDEDVKKKIATALAELILPKETEGTNK